MDCTLRASFSAIPFLASRYWPTNCPPPSRNFRNFPSSGAGHSMIPRLRFRLLAAVRKCKPDVVWFNLLFSTFGRNPLVAFSGLMTPVLGGWRKFHARDSAPFDGHG